jgi:hypothetical protein
VVLISEETSLSALNTVLPSGTFSEEFTSSQICKISPVQKIPRKYSITKNRKSLFIAEEVNNVE